MRYYDVFNGDADGICALHQLRLADPVESTLVTGLKRDIALLEAVPAGEGDVVTVLDISLDRNRAALVALLERGAVVHYFDHHYAGEIPVHPRLLSFIEDSGGSCTSALVDRYLGGRFRAWAVVGAFGDDLAEVALDLARPLGIDAERLGTLCELGASLNYNAYGHTEADVLVPAAELYAIVRHYADPFELVEREPLIGRLMEERRADLERALESRPLRDTPRADAWMLPDAAWARRVSGTFANRLAQSAPHRAHAVLTPRADGGYLVSVRSPRASRPKAVEFCRRFPTGGGRAEAAGVDRLEPSRLDDFLDALCAAWPSRGAAPDEGIKKPLMRETP
jgi:hypothetical protein